ncbi:hypothetical protein NQZ68_010352 [Dissostichus eleginoides]|nr:hypothetical protein NQZ68_010352 [Dissostichus eleginoides]
MEEELSAVEEGRSSKTIAQWQLETRWEHSMDWKFTNLFIWGKVESPDCRQCSGKGRSKDTLQLQTCTPSNTDGHLLNAWSTPLRTTVTVRNPVDWEVFYVLLLYLVKQLKVQWHIRAFKNTSESAEEVLAWLWTSRGGPWVGTNAT